MPWFGDHRHMQVGYNSQRPEQIRRQIEDMISRGIDGVILDWYGPADFTNVTALGVMAEAEKHSGFTFAIMVDKGAVTLSRCAGCSDQQSLVHLVQYVEQTFAPSPAYARVNGRPLIAEFEIDLHYRVDWDAVAAAAASNPMFIFQNGPGFTHVRSNGGYAWVRASDPTYGMNYLKKFYEAADAAAGEYAIGGVYKGFNDTLASWSLNRVMKQQCGQTWLETFAKINSYYNGGHPLDAIQLVTWNDYEEGTELETGIDNCVSISARQAGGSLRWQLSGDESTIDHYQIYISANGRDLMPLNSMSPGSRSLNLASYSLPAGNYVAYVQAIGKPGLTNQISHGVKYTVKAPPDPTPDPPPTPAPPPPVPNPPPAPAPTPMTLTASPSNLSVLRGKNAVSMVTIDPGSGVLRSRVALSCSNLPEGTTCSFSRLYFDQQKKRMVTTLTISTTGSRTAAVHARLSGSRLQYAMLMPGIGIGGLVFAGGRQNRKRLKAALLLGIAAILLLATVACGGVPVAGSSNAALEASTPPGVFTIAVNGNCGTGRSSTPITLRVR